MESGRKTLIVSLHDVHPQSLDAVERQRRLMTQWGVPVRSALVVPCFHHRAHVDADLPFLRAMRCWQDEGDELVLHGYFHDRVGQKESLSQMFWTRLYTNQEAEFLDLSDQDARSRLAQGRDLFARQQWNLQGFIAPAWLFPDRLLGVLRDLGFGYTTRLGAVIPLDPSWISPHDRTQSLCYSARAFWRRLSSRLWNAFLIRRLVAQKRCIRLSLHPADLEYPELCDQVGRFVKTLLEAGFEPETYAGWLSRRQA